MRRRHLVTRSREVTGLEDEVLDIDALDDGLTEGLSGEGALMAAVNAQRTGRMGDIVATIQAEQDRIIRSELRGILVVQGGPGTGKTAVALHRAAFLLYSHRDRLANGGVLVVGPSPVFLRYIEQVLPSLGETGVVMVTPGELLPGVRATRHDPPEVARLKGDLRMAQAVGRAVRSRQRVPDGDTVLDVEGARVVLTPRMVASARDRARRTGRPHNLARATFVKDVLGQLADRLADEIARRAGHSIDPEDRLDLVADLRASVDVRRAVNLAWMPLTPQFVVSRLLSDRDRLEDAAPWLRPHEVDALLRERDAEVTVEDVPLLDEAAELLGEDDAAAQAEAKRAAQQQREVTEYARGVLQMTGAGDMLTADDLRRAAGRRRRRAHPGRARVGRPHLGVPARGGRRGAGAVADGVAGAGAPQPDAVDDGGGRPRPDPFCRRRRRVGSGARPARLRSLAGGGPHRLVPHAGADHVGRRVGAAGRRLHRGRPALRPRRAVAAGGHPGGARRAHRRRRAHRPVPAVRPRRRPGRRDRHRGPTSRRCCPRSWPTSAPSGSAPAVARWTARWPRSPSRTPRGSSSTASC